MNCAGIIPLLSIRGVLREMGDTKIAFLPSSFLKNSVFEAATIVLSLAEIKCEDKEFLRLGELLLLFCRLSV
jgi:hypothetical protein